MFKNRCEWPKTELDIEYHDSEWGSIRKSDEELFEALILETMQSGLSWSTILKKRDALRKVFDNFDYISCSNYTDSYLDELMLNENIIRHRLKIYSVRSNAKIYLKIIEEFSSFYNYIWSFSDYEQITETSEKDRITEEISKDMKKRGFKFVGKTTIYSYLQAVGIINDHDINCFRYTECNKNRG